MRKILILGATGSIGGTCLNAIREHKLPFIVTGVVASSDPALLSIAEEFSCPYLYMKGRKEEELRRFIEESPAEIVLNGIAGSPGLAASVFTLLAHKDLALANKETVVLGGEWIFDLAEKCRAKILPVDSEHSCLYNLINAHGRKNVSELIITASGGPFYTRKDTSTVTLEEALNHPTWKMGKKITIDSATLANKGLEVIEAGYLFGFDSDHIRVTVHRQSVVHSIVKLENGAYYAQLTPPDMTLPIIGALSDGIVPLHDIVKPLDWTDLTLTFGPWTAEQFPLLALAYEALEKRNAYPLAFNMSNEVAVHAFIRGEIAFDDIAKIVEKVVKNNDWSETPRDLETTRALMEKAVAISEKELR